MCEVALLFLRHCYGWYEVICCITMYEAMLLLHYCMTHNMHVWGCIIMYEAVCYQNTSMYEAVLSGHMHVWGCIIRTHACMRLYYQDTYNYACIWGCTIKTHVWGCIIRTHVWSCIYQDTYMRLYYHMYECFFLLTFISLLLFLMISNLHPPCGGVRDKRMSVTDIHSP